MMTLDVSSLPKDPQALRQILIEILGALHERDEVIKRLRHQLAVMHRGRFGRKSEKLDPSQLALFAEQVAAALEEAERKVIPVSEEGERPAGHGRSRMPEHLVKDRREIHPAAAKRSCQGCGKGLTRIGEEITDQLDYVPASFHLKRFIRVKYACRPCGGNVVIAPMPRQPIDKGVAGPGFLAQVLVAKYVDHLPLARQEKIYKRQQVHVSRQSMCDWVGKCAQLLEPVYEAMKGEVLTSSVLHTDDTPVRVQDQDREGTREARMWVYVGDEAHPQTVYDYTGNRSRDGPESFLERYGGKYLQADAYAGYKRIYRRGVREVGCWAHARRYFFDARQSDPVRAETMLAYIRGMYGVEKRAKGKTPAERKALRQSETVAILGEIEAWLREHAERVLPKSPIGEAITYARNQWEALTRFPEDGALEIDNNAAERALRGIAVGRKNWLFFGSDEGGKRAAVIYTLVQTCKRHDIDPWAYLRDVLERLPDHPVRRVAELTPVAWQRAHVEREASAQTSAAVSA